MNAQALPYTLLSLLVELTIGSLWVLFAAHWRGKSAESFVKFGAGSVFVMAGISFWVAAKLHVSRDVDGYPLDPSYMTEARIAVLAVFLLSLPYAVLTFRGSRRAALVSGGAASAAGLVGLALLAQVFALPTWGYAGTLLSLIVGAL